MLAKRQMPPQLETLGRIQWQKFPDNFLTLYPANRCKYVWRYSERMNSCLPPEKAGKNGGLPPGVEEAVIAARPFQPGRPPRRSDGCGARPAESAMPASRWAMTWRR